MAELIRCNLDNKCENKEIPTLHKCNKMSCNNNIHHLCAIYVRKANGINDAGPYYCSTECLTSENETSNIDIYPVFKKYKTNPPKKKKIQKN